MEALNSLVDIKNQIKCIEMLVFKQSDQFLDLRRIDCNSTGYDVDYESAVRPSRFYLLAILEELIHLKDSNRQTSAQYYYNLEQKLLSYDFYREMIINAEFISMKDVCSEMVNRLTNDIKFIQEAISETDYKEVLIGSGLTNLPSSKGAFLAEISNTRYFFLGENLKSNQSGLHEATK